MTQMLGRQFGRVQDTSKDLSFYYPFMHFFPIKSQLCPYPTRCAIINLTFKEYNNPSKTIFLDQSFYTIFKCFNIVSLASKDFNDKNQNIFLNVYLSTIFNGQFLRIPNCKQSFRVQIFFLLAKPKNIYVYFIPHVNIFCRPSITLKL